ncbi:MAG: hydantoinase/oxoprolinase family protein [Planctomycetota bacterium]
MSDAPRLPLSKRCLGLDIGGAHLKAATARGVAKQLLFPLWRRPEELSGAVARLLEIAPPHGALAVTMTGELCDCFESKAEGVAAIVDAVERSAGGRTTRYYTLEGQFVDAEQAVERWSLVAAANWHAMAAALARRDSSRDAALLVDVGSTTSDIVPFSSFGVLLEGCPDDTARLVAGNLLYQGVGRTPVCAVVDHLPIGAPRRRLRRSCSRRRPTRRCWSERRRPARRPTPPITAPSPQPTPPQGWPG